VRINISTTLKNTSHYPYSLLFILLSSFTDEKSMQLNVMPSYREVCKV